MIFNPAHPGEVLRDYLGEMTVAEAATRLGVTRAHLSRILNGRAGVSAAMTLRLSAALGTSPDFWLKMQMQFDLVAGSEGEAAEDTSVPSRNEDKGSGAGLSRDRHLLGVGQSERISLLPDFPVFSINETV